MSKKVIKYHEFKDCEVEGCGEKGIWMWFCKKVLCKKHSEEEFKKYMKALLASLAIVIISLLILFNTNYMKGTVKNTCPVKDCKKEMKEDAKVYFCESCGASIPKDTHRHDAEPDKTVLVEF